MNESRVKDKMWFWIDRFIIQENICPFAKKERESDGIILHVYDAESINATAQVITERYEVMEQNDAFETCIVIASSGLESFDEYLLHLDEAQYHLNNLGYEGVFQLASFHPNYLFEGEAPDALSHFSNRAPYPAFHIIREHSITKALQSFAHPERIPTRNIAHCEKLGHAFFKQFSTDK